MTVSGPVIGPVVVFLDKLDEVDLGTGPLPYPKPARDELEKATLLHEAGHAMGLVDNGLPMVRNHEDPANPGHSSNRRSIMWASVEQLAGIREALARDGTLPLYFDMDDRADMRAVGGR